MVSPSDEELEKRRQRATLVQAAYARLSADQQQLLALVYQDQHTQREVAGALALPLPAVKARLYRGLRELVSLVDSGVKP